MKFENMPNFEGKNNIAISKSEEAKASKIKTEITPISGALLNLNTHLDELLTAMDKVSLCFKNVGLSFEELQKKNIYFNDILSSGYKNLAELFKTWSNNYKAQADFFREEIKYHFKFMEKEYTTFLKNFEDYRLAREEYKRTFDRMKKLKVPTKEDLYSLKDIKKYYAYQLVYINNEYYLLKERQANRLINQFIKYYDNKDVIFQDYQKCISLINFQKHYDMSVNKYKGFEDYEINLENENNNENINTNNTIEENNNYNSYEHNNDENEKNANNVEEDIKKEEIKSDINDTYGNDEKNKEDNNINKEGKNEIITDNGSKIENKIKTDNVDIKEKEENKLDNSEKEKISENKIENKDEKKENTPNNIEESKPVDNNIKKEEEKNEVEKKEEEKKVEEKKEDDKKVEDKKEEEGKKEDTKEEKKEEVNETEKKEN
jgi:hypothetical protein